MWKRKNGTIYNSIKNNKTGINLTKEVKYLYSENYDSDDQNQGRHNGRESCVYRLEELILKMPIISKVYR